MTVKEVDKTKRGWKFFQYYTGDKIPGPTKWIYSIASMFRDASYSLVSAFMLNFLMYSGVLGTGGADYLQQISVITIILVIDLVWDGLNDPIMGLIVEKCHFKHGKFRPWILIGGIGNTIVILCLFLIRPTGWAYVITWAIFYFLWDFVFTMNDIAYWAMRSFLALGREGLDFAAKAAVAAPASCRLPLDSVCLLPPVPWPDKIVCVGFNYVDHATEIKQRDLPEHPIFFGRVQTSLVAHGDPMSTLRQEKRLTGAV